VGASREGSSSGRAPSLDRESLGIEVFKDVIPQVGQTVLAALP